MFLKNYLLVFDKGFRGIVLCNQSPQRNSVVCDICFILANSTFIIFKQYLLSVSLINVMDLTPCIFCYAPDITKLYGRELSLRSLKLILDFYPFNAVIYTIIQFEVLEYKNVLRSSIIPIKHEQKIWIELTVGRFVKSYCGLDFEMKAYFQVEQFASHQLFSIELFYFPGHAQKNIKKQHKNENPL